MKRIAKEIGRVSLGIFSLFIIIAALSSCEESTDNGGPGENEVFIRDMSFSPATITVPVNTTVTWTNKDPVIHTATSNTGVFDSGNMSQGSTFSYTFSTAGTFPYHCTPHPTMTATVIVN